MAVSEAGFNLHITRLKTLILSPIPERLPWVPGTSRRHTSLVRALLQCLPTCFLATSGGQWCNMESLGAGRGTFGMGGERWLEDEEKCDHRTQRQQNIKIIVTKYTPHPSIPMFQLFLMKFPILHRYDSTSGHYKAFSGFIMSSKYIFYMHVTHLNPYVYSIVSLSLHVNHYIIYNAYIYCYILKFMFT